MSILEDVEDLWKRVENGGNPFELRKSFYEIERRGPFVRDHLKSLGPRGAHALLLFDRILAEIDKREKFEEERRHAALYRRRQHVRNLARPFFESDFLNAERLFRTRLSANGTHGEDLKIALDDFEHEKATFVQEWFEIHGPQNDRDERQLPDDEQASAIASTGKYVQIIARAGSGKTSTVVNRTLFLIKHCKIAPNTIMLIAFNRKAVIEIRERLLLSLLPTAREALRQEIGQRRSEDGRRRSALDIKSIAIDAVAKKLTLTLPHVMTFHALAYAIVHPQDRDMLLFDGTEETEGQALSQTVQQIIDDHLRDRHFHDRIRNLMVANFKQDWERIVFGGYDRSKDDLIRYRRSLPNLTLKGDYVKSYGEKIIADFLFEQDVEYKYERNHWWSGVNYRPDFTVFSQPNAGIIIEYFGLAGDRDYDELSDDKRRYWAAKPGWELFEISPKDVLPQTIDSLFNRLSDVLRRSGINVRRLTDEEIWHRIKDRAIDRFSKAMVAFIGRCRKLVLQPEDLVTRLQQLSAVCDVETQFVQIGQAIYSAYLDRLHATGEDDFDGLMQKAAAAIAAGETTFARRDVQGSVANLRYLFIDEYQDFSRLFHDLIMAIRKQNADVSLFCVGDDWQAINGFAGADLKYFRRFEDYVGTSCKRYISTNYRSGSSIVELGNNLMDGLGTPAHAHTSEPGLVMLAYIDEFKPTLLEQQSTPGDAITPAVARLVAKGLQEERDVVLLARRNGIPWFVNYGPPQGSQTHDLERFVTQVRARFPEERRKQISISTTHKYKGLEKPMVIVLDAVTRAYPLIHPDWVFTRILGDSIETIVEEERRLLYVALTRAIHTLVIITERSSFSPFLEELSTRDKLAVVDWDDYPAPIGEGRRVVVKIGNASFGGEGTFEIRDLLKAAGYRWRSTGWKAWEKAFPVTDFSLDRIKKENWAKNARGIEVRLCDESESVVAAYLVNGAHWQCVQDNRTRHGFNWSAPQGGKSP